MGDTLDESTLRVLIVDDYEQWRNFLRSLLQTQPGLQVIDEAQNGPEAIRKAYDLRPDLVLLDIGLPGLNGIEVARQIREGALQPQILFVSENRSSDIVEEALNMGASGYVVKSDAAGEILPALEAVRQGRRFISGSVAAHDPSNPRTRHNSDDLHSKLALNKAHATGTDTDRHAVGFYSDDPLLLDDLTQFVASALEAGNAVIVVATESHRIALLPKLGAYGVDVATAIGQGRYIALDAAETLASFMIDDMPDSDLFLGLLGDLIAAVAGAAQGKHPRVSIFGECVHLLWAQGNAKAAIEMEKLGNHLTKIYDVDILCGYCVGTVPTAMDRYTFETICAEHTVVRDATGVGGLQF